MDSLSGPRAGPVAADELSEIERAKALVDQAHAARNSNARHGVALAREAIDIARRLGQRHILARALSILSACLRGISELVEAARCAREAAALFEQLDDASGEALAQINSGIALSMVGQMSDALWSFERARDLNQRLHNRIGEADALMDIAVIYNMLGDDAQALSLYDEVLPIYESLDDTYHYATALNNAAFAHVSWGIREARASQPEAAQSHFTQAIAKATYALPLAENCNHPEFLVSCLDTLASAYREIGRFDQCFATLARQLELARGLDGRRMEAITLGNLGEAQRRAGELDKAVDTLEAADAAYSAMQLCDQHAATLSSLSLAYEQCGRLQEALDTYRRFHRVETQLKSAAAEQKTHVLEARLKLEKMESELALAHAREAELASLNAQLSSADREKSVLLRKLERQSYEDSLTGLHNRRSLDARLSADFLRARRYHNPLSVALADLDYFKQINDRLSHAVGDDVLRVIAHVMRESIRATDYAARYGGEEFALVFAETKLDDAVAVCEKIRRRIEAYEWSKVHQDLRVTISFGVTEATASSKSHEDLIAVADRLLYRAKRAGKNQVVPAPDGTSEAA